MPKASHGALAGCERERDTMNAELARKIERLHGPILVLGASGFVGSNLFRSMLEVRPDVYGTASRLPAWRLEGLPDAQVLATDLLVESNLRALLDHVRPLTVFDCVAYGAYSYERDPNLIYRTNLSFAVRLAEELCGRNLRAYLHAGSSSEYGEESAAPSETASPKPNSHYAASKVAAAGVLHYMGHQRGLPCANLRLYSVYGPWEDASRLLPTVALEGLVGRLPPFVDPAISRDFLYAGDAVEAFVDAALGLEEEHYGESFNVGTGTRTTIAEVAKLAREVFGIDSEPDYSMPARDWDTQDWYADPQRMRECFGWRARTSFEQGFRATVDWVRGLEDREAYLASSRRFGLNTRHSVSAVVACYKDAEAIPIMHERLVATFEKLGVDHEIIFVNDGSPDES